MRQACPVCGVFFFASWWVVARGRGRYCSRACTPTSYPKPRRDGDRKQARERIGYLVRKGTLPPARTLACTDCGLPAADYDHFLGYGAAHHEKVQPVCRKCHTQRGIARGENRPPAVTPTTGPCRICGSDKGPFRHRRCNACRLYLTYHGHDRIIAS